MHPDWLLFLRKRYPPVKGRPPPDRTIEILPRSNRVRARSARAAVYQQCAPTWHDLSPIPKSALQTSCGSPARSSGRNPAGFPECSIPHLLAAPEAACAQPAAHASPAIQPIWRVPDGTIPSGSAVQARVHPCGPSSPSSLIKPPSHAASPAERLQILLASARHAATVITARPQIQSASPGSQVPGRRKQQRRAHSRPSPPSRSCPAHPQRKRSRVPTTRRFRHNVPRLSSISRCLGPTQRRDPVSSSIGGQPPSPLARSEAHYGI